MRVITGIYCIRNTITGSVYIGSSKNIAQRWSAHKTDLRSKAHFNQPLINAWHKYGDGAFELLILEECDVLQLGDREQFHLDNAMNTPGTEVYNLSPVAERTTLSQGARIQLSERMKGNTYTLGFKHSEETRKRMSEARKGVPKNPESKKNYQRAALKREARIREECQSVIVETPDWLRRWKDAQ
jgi:group I intron endonuclease